MSTPCLQKNHIKLYYYLIIGMLPESISVDLSMPELTWQLLREPIDEDGDILFSAYL